MAKGRKTGGRDWKPGESGNPKGAETLPSDIVQARKLTTAEFERICNKYLFMTQADFKEESEKPTITMLECVIGRIIQQAVFEGDQMRLNFLLDRLIGRVVQPISNPDGSLTTPIVRIYLPRNGRESKETLKDAIEVDPSEITKVD